jgi:hypothetical protein
MSFILTKEAHEVDALGEHLTNNFEDFSKFCFKIMTGQKMLDVDYYSVLFETDRKSVV